MKRYNEEFAISTELMDVIAGYMDDENIERNAYSRIAAEFEIAKRKCKSQSEVDSLWDSVYGPMVDRAMDAAENMFCLT